MSEFVPDFGLTLHDAGREGAVVFFSRVLLPHVGRVEADAFCSTVNLSMESEFAVTFDFDRVALRDLLALLPSAAGVGLGSRLSTSFEEPELIEFSSPITVGVEAVVGSPIENDDERYVPLRVRAFRAPAPTPTIDIKDSGSLESSSRKRK